jgi:signal transduction histidine kinase
MRQKTASQREVNSSWLSVLVAIGTLAPLLLKAGLVFLQQSNHSPESAEYEVWRQRLLRSRLQWIVRIALFVTLFTLMLEFVTAGFAISLRLFLYGAVALSLYACYSLRRTAIGRTHPGIVFLGICWSIALIPGLEYLLERNDLPNLNLWTLTFLVNALLIPIYWSLHLLSQVGVLAFYLGVSLMEPTQAASGSPLQQGLYLFWVCLICDLSVYLHEQFQRYEFSSKWHQRYATAASELTTELPTAQPERDEDDNSDQPRGSDRGLNYLDRRLHRVNAALIAYLQQAEMQRFKCQPLELRTVIQAAIVQVEPLLEQQQVSVSNTISPTLPLVNADPKQLQLVFEHLIKDALERHLPGITLIFSAEVIERTGRKFAQSPTRPTMLRCIVQDDGISDESQLAAQAVDSPALEIENDRPERIGFTLSEPIIQRHGGELGSISGSEGGTIVWFTLPIAAHQTLSYLHGSTR